MSPYQSVFKGCLREIVIDGGSVGGSKGEKEPSGFSAHSTETKGDRSRTLSETGLLSIWRILRTDIELVTQIESS